MLPPSTLATDSCTYIAPAMSAGVQNWGVAANVKHFAANNQETNRYNNNSIVSERAMREIYLKGFEIAIRESHPKALMTSYNLLNGEHTSQFKNLVEEILRGEFGYEGLVMTDWIITGQIFNPASVHPTMFARHVIKAGNELIMPGTQADYDNLYDALQTGEITREEINICAWRVLRAIRELLR